MMFISLLKTCFLNGFGYHSCFYIKASAPKKENHFLAVAIVFTVNPYYCPSTAYSVASLTHRQENSWKETQLYGISSKPQQMGGGGVERNSFVVTNFIL